MPNSNSITIAMNVEGNDRSSTGTSTSEKVPAVVTGDKFLHVVTSDNQQYFFFYYDKLYRLVVTSNTSIC